MPTGSAKPFAAGRKNGFPIERVLKALSRQYRRGWRCFAIGKAGLFPGAISRFCGILASVWEGVSAAPENAATKRH
jgi:hypothetical protein